MLGLVPSVYYAPPEQDTNNKVSTETARHSTTRATVCVCIVRNRLADIDAHG
jgi:hypothetical protein